MHWKDLLDSLLGFFAKQPARQHMQDVGSGNVQVRKLQGNLVQGHLPEINIHIHHGSAQTSGAVPSEAAMPPVVQEPAPAPRPPPVATIVDVPMQQRQSVAANARRIDPPEIIELRREVFDWLKKFDQLPCGRAVVYEFMEDKLGSSEVMSLDKLQLLRVVGWCQVVYRAKRRDGARRRLGASRQQYKN